MNTLISKFALVILCLTLTTFTNWAWSGESCNALLKLGLYNVTQSSSSIDAQSLITSTFCSYDYSQISETSSQAATIKAAYGLFSGGASGSVSRQDIITKQSSVCTYGYDSSRYIKNTSDYSKTVYQGSLDAWNQCQAIASQNLNLNVQPSSTMQGVSVSISVPSGYDAWFYGVAQYGAGRSDCSVYGSNGLMNVTPTSPVKVNAASLLTVSCARQMDKVGNDFFADAQYLVFITSKSNLTVPLAAMGNLSRITVDQINGQTDAKIKAQTTPITTNLSSLTTSFNDLTKSFGGRLTTLESYPQLMGVFQRDDYLRPQYSVNNPLTGSLSCPPGANIVFSTRIWHPESRNGSVQFICAKK